MIYDLLLWRRVESKNVEEPRENNSLPDAGATVPVLYTDDGLHHHTAVMVGTALNLRVRRHALYYAGPRIIRIRTRKKRKVLSFSFF